MCEVRGGLGVSTLTFFSHSLVAFSLLFIYLFFYHLRVRRWGKGARGKVDSIFPSFPHS